MILARLKDRFGTLANIAIGVMLCLLATSAFAGSPQPQSPQPQANPFKVAPVLPVSPPNSGATGRSNNQNKAIYTRAEAAIRRSSYVQAHELFIQACEDGHAISCEKAGIMHIAWELPGERNIVEAYRSFATGCDLGAAISCTAAGDLLLRYWNISPASPTEGPAFYRRACDGGNLIGCAKLASTMRTLPASAQNNAEMLALASSTCTQTVGVGCAVFATILRRGMGDTPREIAAYENGCRLNDGDSCWNLGEIRAIAAKSPAARRTARALFQKACDLNSAQGCHHLANNLGIDGAGVRITTNQQPLVRIASVKSCHLGYGLGCYMAGLDFADAQYGEADQLRARGLFSEGCAQDNTFSCDYLALFMITGTAGPQDRMGAYGIANRKCVPADRDALTSNYPVLSGRVGLCGLLGEFLYIGSDGVGQNQALGLQMLQTACGKEKLGGYARRQKRSCEFLTSRNLPLAATP